MHLYSRTSKELYIEPDKESNAS